MSLGLESPLGIAITWIDSVLHVSQNASPTPPTALDIDWQSVSKACKTGYDCDIRSTLMKISYCADAGGACMINLNSSVTLPIHGLVVQFHINTIKNASTNNEGGFTYLQINPRLGSVDRHPAGPPFRGHYRDVLLLITDLKKGANKREQRETKMADVIKKGAVVALKGRRIAFLTSLVRAIMVRARFHPAELMIHMDPFPKVLFTFPFATLFDWVHIILYMLERGLGDGDMNL
ncbi:hypothetical protein NMY22_g6840 [Coprinellus aureogranulatus]|nr:hypothetical protein NMY22_g6840 [Coprinellus aureogranulatus]